jgi:Rps23 Pro-64 3,4-dihydroxylase Tpa1-like proline 4-hydroxylase
MNNTQIVDLIIDRLSRPIIKKEKGQFKYWIIKDLLPNDLACKIAKSFPNEDALRKRDSLREYKRVGVDFESYHPLMEKITYAFHDSKVVDLVSKITGFNSLVPDHELYAGGLSSMSKNSFLNPHLDNSHNDNKSMYRVLNLLYYVSKDWKLEYGGNLLLFPKGMNKSSETIFSEFNSLVLMETNNLSYHGVTKVKHVEPRRCVSNYYFSLNSTNGINYNHITSFFPFQEEGVFKKISLLFDRNIRGFLSKHYKKIISHQNWHKRK